MSKSELGNWPVFGFIAKQMSTILINRKDIRDTHRVNGEITRVMNDELGVVVFAEGGVSQTGELLPFKAPLLQPAVDLVMPVNYTTIHYRTPYRPEAMEELILWRDGVSFIRHFLNIGSLPYCEATLVFGDGTVKAEDRKTLATGLYDAVAKQQGQAKTIPSGS